MSFVHVDPIIKKMFPRQWTFVLGQVDLKISDDVYTTQLEQLRAHCAKTMQGKPLEAHDTILHWRSLFATMGASPKYTSSVEGLLSRYLTHGTLYTIHPVVDLYNWTSLAYLTPMAAYDVAHIDSAITLRPAHKGELFTPLGNPKQQEKTKQGEIVYADQSKVICRYWNLRDCHETRITSDTKKATFNGDITADTFEEAREIATHIAKSLQPCMAQDVAFDVMQ